MVNDTLFDKGGAVYNVKATGYGVVGNGSTDDRAALNTLLNTTITPGGTAYFPPSVYLIGSALTTPAGVALQFAAGAVIKLGTSVVLTINGPLQAPLSQLFDVSNTGAQVAFGVGAVEEILPEWWGLGSTTAETTRAFRAAFSAATAARLEWDVPEPGGGGGVRRIGLEPAVVLATRRYRIDGELDYGPYCRLRSPGGAIIEQTAANRRILYTANNWTYDTLIEGVHFVGGTRHVEYINPNLNGTTLKLVDCSFDNSADFSVWTLGSVAVNGDSPLAVLKSAVAAGNTVLHLTVSDPANKRLLFVGSHLRLRDSTNVFESAVTAVSWLSGNDVDVTVATAATFAFAVATTAVLLKALTTLAAAPAAGSGTLSVNGSGTLALLEGLHIALANPRGEIHSTVITAVTPVSSTWTLTLLDPIPAHWTSADGAQPAAGALVRAGDLHLSANVTIERCQFINPRKAIHNTADSMVVRGDTWMQVSPANFKPDSAVITHLSGDLHLDGLFGVSLVGSNPTLRENMRWIDMAGAGYGLYATDCRFGGEDAGIPVVDFRTPPLPAYPYLLTRVVIENSYVAAGGSFAGSGVLRLRRAVPQLFVYRDCTGPIETPIILNGAVGDAGVNLDTYFPADAQEIYRLQLGPMLDFASHGAGLMPAQLRPFANVADTRRLPVGPVYGKLVPGETTKHMVTFRIPGDIVALQAFVTMSTCPNVAGSYQYRLTRSDMISVYTSWNGTAITEYVGNTPQLVPTPPGASGQTAPSVVSVHFGTAGTGAATRAQDGSARDITLVYDHCTGGYTTASLLLLHGGL